MQGRIVHCKKFQFDEYIGRPSKWGNPFVIGKDGAREQVIELYRLWINCQPDLLGSLGELKGKTLGCWCNYPSEDCHGSILIDLSESKYIKNWFSNMLAFEQPLIHQGISYKSVENFYQAMKISKTKIDLRKEISEMSPFKSKTEIRNKEKYPWDEEWNKEKALKVMEAALKHKFKIGTNWRRLLDLTSNWEIVEWNNWGDTYYGKDIKTQVGENHLGKILMDIRDKF